VPVLHPASLQADLTRGGICDAKSKMMLCSEGSCRNHLAFLRKEIRIFIPSQLRPMQGSHFHVSRTSIFVLVSLLEPSIPSSSRRYCISLDRCSRAKGAHLRWTESGRSRTWRNPCVGGGREARNTMSIVFLLFGVQTYSPEVVDE
jgi:hypothetical protein